MLQIHEELCAKGLCTDKGNEHSYLRFYEGLFCPLKRKSIQFLEIGILLGHSMALWQKYFEAAKLTGIDINDDPHRYKEGYEFILGDCRAPEVLARFADNQFNVIIDDGCHCLQHQLGTFLDYWPKLAEGGIYIIEDVQPRLEDAIMVATPFFKSIGIPFQIIDHRGIKKRSDDALFVIIKNYVEH